MLNTEFITRLMLAEVDVDGARKRLEYDDALYFTLLKAFANDSTMNDLEKAIDARLWDDAFTAAHALKGLAGNLGLIPLYHSVGQLVMLIRTGKISEIDEIIHQVRESYDEIIKIINCYK